MSLLTLATRDDIPRLLPLVAGYHEAAALATAGDERRAALEALFDQRIQAAIWLIGPQRAPVGYIAVAFGYSIALGGRDATIDEFFVRPAVRGRGMGSQALHLLLPMLRRMGVRAVHMRPAPEDSPGARLMARAGFAPAPGPPVMTRRL